MNRTLFNLLCELVVGFKREFVLLIVVLLLDGVIAATSVLALAPLADYLLDPSLSNPSRVTRFVLESGLTPGLIFFGVLFIFSNLLKCLLEIATRFTVLRIKYSVLREIIRDTLKTVLLSRWIFFVNTSQGRLMNTFQRELIIVGDSLGALANWLATFLQFFIYFLVPFLVNAKMTLIALVTAIILGMPFLLVNRLSYRLGKKSTETSIEMHGVLLEILTGAKLILSYARQHHVLKRYISAFDRHVWATLRSQALTSAVGSFYQLMAITAAIVALIFAAEQRDQLAEIAVVLWSLLKALPMIGRLLAGKTSIDNFLPSYEQLQDLRIDAASERETNGSKLFSRLTQSLSLKHVDFSYPGRKNILQDVNLEVTKGSMTALVGESGAGKSTVADMLLGLLIPERGELSIDGVPLAEWDLASYRRRLGYVPQDPFLFHTSIRENLLWSSDGEVSEERLWEVCRIANAVDFIKELPEGLDTIVGDRGVRLSGGQRQRLALARALMCSPEILILDEATSALDTNSELLIQKSIEQVAKNTTIFVIAHRLSTIVKADIVYVMSAGRIAQQGSFTELIDDHQGPLAGMVSAQQLLE